MKSPRCSQLSLPVPCSTAFHYLPEHPQRPLWQRDGYGDRRDRSAPDFLDVAAAHPRRWAPAPRLERPLLALYIGLNARKSYRRTGNWAVKHKVRPPVQH